MGHILHRRAIPGKCLLDRFFRSCVSCDFCLLDGIPYIKGYVVRKEPHFVIPFRYHCVVPLRQNILLDGILKFGSFLLKEKRTIILLYGIRKNRSPIFEKMSYYFRKKSENLFCSCLFLKKISILLADFWPIRPNTL